MITEHTVTFKLTLALAAVVMSVALSACGSGRQSAASPACLPKTARGSAKLNGLPVYVSPAPNSVTANPNTQISFLGLPAAEIHGISVQGQRSGTHTGKLRAYSQEDGASYLLDEPLQGGELVQVRAVIEHANVDVPVSFSFTVDHPYQTADVPPFPNPAAPPSEYQTFHTLPGVKAPLMTVRTPDRDPAAGDVLMTNGPGPGAYGPLIYTPQGQLVWFDQLSGDLTAENLAVQSFEGRPHLTYWKGKVLSLGFGQGEDLILDDHYRTVAVVRAANGLRADLHDFQIAPDDVAYITAYNPIRCDLSSVGGRRDGAINDGVIQAIDIRTGLVRWEWHSLQHLAVDESQTEAPSGTNPWDWFHLNSVDVEPGGDLFVSARSTWAGYQVDSHTGEILWRLGGSKSSFAMGPGTRTAWQHDGRMISGDQVTFFDNGSNPPEHSQSRAIRIALDFKHHRATLSSVRSHPDHLLAASQGNVQTLATGNTVVGFGAVPETTEFSATGAILFDAHLPLDMDSYRSLRFPWHGYPQSPPAVSANFNNTGEEMLVRMSFNGATDVSAWRILAGESPSSLKAMDTVPATGFESGAIIARRRRYVQAQALDGDGRTLGSSKAVVVSPYSSSFQSPGRG